MKYVWSTPAIRAFPRRFLHSSSRLFVDVSVLNRYASKLKRKAAESDVSVEKLLRDAEKLHAIDKKNTTHVTQSSTKRLDSTTNLKKLHDFVDLDKVETLTTEQATELWKEFCLRRPCTVGAVLPASMYKRMLETAKRYPVFVLPIPRGQQGLETHILQWLFPQENTAHLVLTTLLEYKLRREYAVPHTTVLHFPELSETKKIVLTLSEFDPNKSISALDVQILLHGVQKFFTSTDTSITGRRRLEMLRSFNDGCQYDLKQVAEDMDMLE
ncbi:F1-ATPase chaperone Atp11 [Schizosaccharomyces japonicus yFS275]|uniref:F1-ATPase chaperone Atp11 n=1 Tax=Schizosaccharomyces japonicus (strain yFS275 / FY16936) TaxID=402676 RepID=B6K823_SCHJY|nr:F1-ATPase chaperone Atp11 [Schizosaccharomyces japonicus yFS275]EEB09677.1 F1-ATPase chaperone Atp11 [Schizosaccharomyces japonicus yFS275]